MRYGAPHVILILLLVAGYFSGYLKLATLSMWGYVLPDVLCILLFAATFAQRDRLVRFPRSGLSIAILLLALFCLLELVNPQSPLVRSLAGFRSWMLYTCLFFVGYQILRGPQQLQHIYSVILLLSAVTAVYGIYQWRVGPTGFVSEQSTVAMQEYASTMAWQGEHGGDYIFRSWSTFVAPGVFGGNMALGFLIGLVVLTTQQTPARMKWLAAAAMPLMAGGILASGSRSPVVVAALGTLLILMLRRGRATMPAMISVAIAAFVAVTLTSSVVSARYVTLLNAELVIQKWLGPLTDGIAYASENAFGKGLGYTAGMPTLGTFQQTGVIESYEGRNVDSGIGAAAAEMGFGGMFLFVFLLTQLAGSPFRAWKRVPPGLMKDLMIAPVTFALVFALTAVIAPMSASLPLSVYMWILIGMSIRAPLLPTPPEAYPAGQARDPAAPRGYPQLLGTPSLRGTGGAPALHEPT